MELCIRMFVVQWTLPSPGRAIYYVLFKDDFCGFCLVYFMKNKSGVPGHFKTFMHRLKGQTGRDIKVLRSDKGGEYLGNDFQLYLFSHKIQHHTTVARIPEQNGVAERTNRTIKETARILIQTIVRRIGDLSANLKEKVSDKACVLDFFPIACDESTVTTATAQLLIF